MLTELGIYHRFESCASFHLLHFLNNHTELFCVQIYDQENTIYLRLGALKNSEPLSKFCPNRNERPTGEREKNMCRALLYLSLIIVLTEVKWVLPSHFSPVV